ncbi:MAG TPA: deoxyribodipyrimidine photo-lyase [Chitinophagaceae bacterium]|nr:deoxyribodipyrimidine photo-lyase [Chitinophagaceae bacterium]
MKELVNIFWFRRDLRFRDNAGLYYALSAGLPVVPVFIFDTHILNTLDDRSDARVHFIHNSLEELQEQLLHHESSLHIINASPVEAFTLLKQEYNIRTVFTNHDFEPYAVQRDMEVERSLAAGGVFFKTFKDHVIFEKDELMKTDGSCYTVYTPYSNKWLQSLKQSDLIQFDSESLMHYFLKQPERIIPSLASIGFSGSNIPLPPSHVREEVIGKYDLTRNFPGQGGTSQLGVHLRFGTISIRHLVQTALKLNQVFLKELIWREFFMQLLWHKPHLQNQCFKRQYESIKWRNSEAEFIRWCSGNTGYPIVDAGMRELNHTGFMHNRVRMITASFLVKHLLIDWRWGESYFASKLLDYELASNNGNWQWVAGCGCDAAPYFRIFNPLLQAKKFDPQQLYIKKWVPEFGFPQYPTPIVNHEEARKRCLAVYGNAVATKL